MVSFDIPPFILKWIHSFMDFNGGMTQGTWLGLYVSLILINDLETSAITFKFVEDVTLTKVLASGDTEMQLVADKIQH